MIATLIQVYVNEYIHKVSKEKKEKLLIIKERHEHDFRGFIDGYRPHRQEHDHGDRAGGVITQPPCSVIFIRQDRGGAPVAR
jgi:hypothetical protein